MRPPVKLYLLIGHSVEKSLSPAIHNAAFNALNLDAIYVAVDVPERSLADAIGGVRALGIAGFNVTIPHKISVMKFLDEVDESAKSAGAVNTVVNRRGKLVGYNTDGEGAMRALMKAIRSIKGRQVVLLGAGGAGRGIAVSLAKAGAALVIANRTVERAKALASMAEEFGAEVSVVSVQKPALKKIIGCADVLINATSVGMWPESGRTLVTSDMMHRNLIVMDIVYKPLKTKLLAEAKKAGAKTIDGLGMLVNQGALSFEMWTGKRAPVKVMKTAVKREMGKVSKT
ncbi:MAG: shikimate dehydrogenase [Candidatus Hadarchaeota archaeon]